MNPWYCGCTPPKVHPAGTTVCLDCGFIAPPDVPPPAPAPILTPDERARMLGLAEWLDAEVAKRPKIALSPVGTGLSLMIDRARREPDAAYQQIMDATSAAQGLIAWVTQAVPPDPSYLERLIGPAPGAPIDGEGRPQLPS
jgi:hypothetical protein